MAAEAVVFFNRELVTDFRFPMGFRSDSLMVLRSATQNMGMYPMRLPRLESISTIATGSGDTLSPSVEVVEDNLTLLWKNTRSPTFVST